MHSFVHNSKEIMAKSSAAAPPTIGFDQSNGNQFIIREGESLQLCVVLVSGRIPFEFTFSVDINGPQGSTSEYYIIASLWET